MDIVIGYPISKTFWMRQSKAYKHIRGYVELFFRNDWHQEINNSTKSPKLRLYKESKETILPEPYLFINIPIYRHAIAQLRLSSHH